MIATDTKTTPPAPISTTNFYLGFALPMGDPYRAVLYWRGLEFGNVYWMNPNKGWGPKRSGKWEFNRGSGAIQAEWHPEQSHFDSVGELIGYMEDHFPHGEYETAPRWSLLPGWIDGVDLPPNGPSLGERMMKAGTMWRDARDGKRYIVHKVTATNLSYHNAPGEDFICGGAHTPSDWVDRVNNGTYLILLPQ